MKSLIILTTLVLTATQAYAADSYANIHSVAIISSLGDDVLLRQKADLTDSNLAPSVFFDSKGNIDKYVTQTIADAVSSRFTVVDGTLDPALLKNYPLSKRTRDRLQDRFVNGPKTEADAIIVIHPIVVDTPTPIRVLTYESSGLTLSHIKLLWGGYGATLSVDYMVSIFDPKTGKKLDYGTASTVVPSILQKPFGLMACDKTIWPADPEHPDENSAKQIRADVMAAIAFTLPVALKSAHLINGASTAAIKSWEGTLTLCKAIM